MTANISCFYINSYRQPINITFIKYEDYFKILFLNNKPIIISIQQFMKIPKLFEWYILSLVATYDNNIIKKNNEYGILTQEYSKDEYFTSSYDLIYLEKHSKKNPLKSQKPKRQSSVKKIKKFIKAYNYYLNNGEYDTPLYLLNDLINTNISNYFRKY